MDTGTSRRMPGLLAAVMGAFTVMVGPRACVIIGSLTVTAGLLAAVPAVSIVHIAFTLGALVGVGLCMSETPGFLAVTDYFQDKRALANGFRAAGNPLGGVLFSPLVVALHQYFGLQGALILMAGIMLHMAILGALMRPFQIHQNLVQAEFWKDQARQNTPGLRVSSSQQIKPSDQKRKKKKPLNFRMLKNPSYLIYLLMVMCVNIAMPNALLYTPTYGKSIGLSAYENSVIASYTSACDFVMRLLCGWTSSLKLYEAHHGLIAGLLVGGIGCLLTPLCNNMWQLLGAATSLSFCMAFFWTLINTLLADEFGGDAMASTWGFFRMTQGICSFLYPSLIVFLWRHHRFLVFLSFLTFSIPFFFISLFSLSFSLSFSSLLNNLLSLPSILYLLSLPTLLQHPLSQPSLLFHLLPSHHFIILFPSHLFFIILFPSPLFIIPFPSPLFFIILFPNPLFFIIIFPSHPSPHQPLSLPFHLHHPPPPLSSSLSFPPPSSSPSSPLLRLIYYQPSLSLSFSPGLVLDATGGLTIPYLMMGSALVLGAGVFSLRPLIARISGPKKELNPQSSSSLRGEPAA
ncbi:hypothetical protein C7M84_005613 [Penaeus vannamei]|uniref:Uncharacterized protein n=1 Tax=Penaeus vannamei TaxID=6689 RepID=A0A423THI1_PENVA|nr:hypothetical protein C7M84_005613 [Penaeus vannamei]